LPDRNSSIKTLLSNYPFAYDRLEELYQKHPNLRLSEFQPADGASLIDELNQYVEGLSANELRLPDGIRDQLRGKAEWDENGISRFLAEKEESINRLLKIASLSTKEARFRYLIAEGSPEILNAQEPLNLLKLAFLHEVRIGDPNRAELIFTSLGKVMEATSKPFLIHAVSENSNRGRLLANMRDLAKSGYDVSSYTDELRKIDSQEILTNGLRLEVGSFISLLEAAKQVEDRVALQEHMAPLMRVDMNNQPSMAEQQLMREEGMTWDINDFQDSYAKALSAMVDLDLKLPRETRFTEIEDSFSNLSEGRKLILKKFLPQINPISSAILKTELLTSEVVTWNAINQASSDGLNPTTLSDLIPGFLSEIPVNPINNKPFILDVKTQTLNIRD